MEVSVEKKDLSQNHAKESQTVPLGKHSAAPLPTVIIGQAESPEPSEYELVNLRHIGGSIPAAAWFVALFSGAERFAFYALQAPLQNYIQYPADGFGRPGALGMGQSAAVALNNFLELVCYTTPIFAGVLADGHWGPYKTLVVSCWYDIFPRADIVVISFTIRRVYLSGIILLLLTSIPQALEAGAGLGGLIGAIVLIGLGVGGVKSSVAPFTGIVLSIFHRQ
ncbi:MAG: hypothetical protein Q9168_002465 [Polycauliona sp. 1 TL-2023]